MYSCVLVNYKYKLNRHFLDYQIKIDIRRSPSITSSPSTQQYRHVVQIVDPLNPSSTYPTLHDAQSQLFDLFNLRNRILMSDNNIDIDAFSIESCENGVMKIGNNGRYWYVLQGVSDVTIMDSIADFREIKFYQKFDYVGCLDGLIEEQIRNTVFDSRIVNKLFENDGYMDKEVRNVLLSSYRDNCRLFTKYFPVLLKTMESHQYKNLMKKRLDEFDNLLEILKRVYSWLTDSKSDLDELKAIFHSKETVSKIVKDLYKDFAGLQNDIISSDLRRNLDPLCNSMKENRRYIVAASYGHQLFKLIEEPELHNNSIAIFNECLKNLFAKNVPNPSLYSINSTQPILEDKTGKSSSFFYRYNEITVFLYQSGEAIFWSKDKQISVNLVDNAGENITGFNLDLCIARGNLLYLVVGGGQTWDKSKNKLMLADLSTLSHDVANQNLNLKWLGTFSVHQVMLKTAISNKLYAIGMKHGATKTLTLQTLVIYHTKNPAYPRCTVLIGTLILSTAELAELRGKEITVNDLFMNGDDVIVGVTPSTTHGRFVWYFALKCMPGQPPRYLSCTQVYLDHPMTYLIQDPKWIVASHLPVLPIISSDFTYSLVCFLRRKFHKIRICSSRVMMHRTLPNYNGAMASKYVCSVDSDRMQLYLLIAPREDDVSSPYTILPLKITLY